MPIYTPAFREQLKQAGINVDETLQSTHESALDGSAPESIKPFRRKNVRDAATKQHSLFNVYHQSLAINKLGKGGFGVAKKHIASTGEIFAMKSVELKDSICRLDFNHEVTVLKLLKRHLGSGIRKRDNNYDKGYIAMPFIEGAPLQQLVTRTSPQLTGQQVLSLFLCMINEVEKLHALGYLHNDINPRNFMINLKDRQNPRAVLIDFGASRPIGQMSETYSAYTAPECHGYSRRHPSADVYALGLCLDDLVDTCLDRHDTDMHAALKKLSKKMTYTGPVYRPDLANLRAKVTALQNHQTTERSLVQRFLGMKF